MTPAEITAAQHSRKAAIYIRQSTLTQVAENLESQRRQYGLVERAAELGWRRSDILVIDDDLGASGSGISRTGFDRLVAEVGLGHIGAVFAIEVSRLARNNRDSSSLATAAGDGDSRPQVAKRTPPARLPVHTEPCARLNWQRKQPTSAGSNECMESGDGGLPRVAVLVGGGPAPAGPLNATRCGSQSLRVWNAE